MGPCRVVPFEVADGPGNMGLDEALLDAVAAGESPAVVRVYGWSEPTLSLGYFQPIARAEAEPRWRGVPTVRRPTGGGALWHDREVTYALVVPAAHPLARRARDLYRAVHAAIGDLLAGVGLDAGRRGDAGGACEKPFLCFADRDAEDVVAGSTKLVGSAQRRRSGAVLQHGSILLARSPRTPELPGVAELARADVEPERWSAGVAGVVTRALGLDPFASESTPAERRLAGRLAEAVYRDPAWTRKR